MESIFSAIPYDSLLRRNITCRVESALDRALLVAISLVCSQHSLPHWRDLVPYIRRRHLRYLERDYAEKIPMTHILRTGTYINMQVLGWYTQFDQVMKATKHSTKRGNACCKGEMKLHEQCYSQLALVLPVFVLHPGEYYQSFRVRLVNTSLLWVESLRGRTVLDTCVLLDN